MSAGKEVGVRLKVSGEGLENVSALTRELDKAGVSTDGFDEKAKALSAEFTRLAQQQALIDQFARTKIAVDAAATEMEAAQAKAQGLGRDLAATAAPARAQATALEEARAAAAAARQTYQVLATDLDQLSRQQALIDQFKLQKAAVRDAATTMEVAQIEAQTLARELAGIEAPTRAQSRAFDQAKASVRAATEAYQDERLVLQQLRGQLSDAGLSGDDLAAAQSRVRAQFAAAKAAIEATAQALRDAQVQEKLLTREIAASEGATKTQTQALDKARAAVTAADAAYQAQVGQLQQLRTQLGAAGVSADDLAAAQVRVHSQLDATRKGVADLAGELQTLNGQQQGLQALGRLAQDTDLARLALSKADDAVELFKRGMINAAEPTKVEQQQLAKLTETARQAQIAVQQQSVQQALTNAGLRTAAVSTEQLTAAQARGRAQAIATVSATDSVSASTRNMTAAQQAAEREIRQIQTALEQMAFNARVSGAEFDKAFTTGQARIAKLRAEVATVPPALDASTRSADLLGEGMRRAAVYFSAFTIGKQFIDANTQIDSLRRTLVLITGSTDKASQQLAFLKKTADDTGVSVASLAGPFSKFVASAGAAGVSLETIDHLFASVTKASALLGLSSEDTAGALLALGQMASKGKVSMEELGQQLGDRLPAVLATTAKGLGITTAEMTKLIDQGGLLADESFFRAFAKGVDETFVKGAGKVTGFRAELGRLKNDVNSAFTDVAGAGGMQILLGIVGLLRGGLVALVSVLTIFGSALGTTAAAAVDLAKKLLTLDWPGLKRGAQQAREALYDLELQLAKTIPPDASKRVPILGALMTLLALDTKRVADNTRDASRAQQASVAASAAAATGHQANAKAQDAAAAAAKGNAAAQGAAGTVAGQAVDRWVSLGVAFDGLIDKAKQAAETNAKVADSTKAAGDASVALAQVAGNEIHSREAATAAAEANAKALTAVASAKQSEADLSQIKIGALRQEAIDTGTLTDARKKELIELELKLKGLQAEAQGANEAAEAARNEALARNIAIQSAKDNSGALAELKTAYELARNALAVTTLEEQKGVATKRDVSAAARSAAAAEALYHDALDDTSAAIGRNIERQKLALDIRQATLNLEKASLQSQLDVATLNGNDALALDARIRLKLVEIQIIEAKVAATKAEAQATLAKADADRAALVAEGKLTDDRKLAIDAAIAGAKVKLLEADAAAQQTKALQQQIDNLRIYGDEAGKARNRSRAALDDETKAYGRNTAAIEKNAAAAKAAADSAALSQIATNYVNSPAYQLQNKRDANTLKASDQPAAQANFDAAKANLTQAQANLGAFSIDAVRSLQAQFNVARDILEKVQLVSRPVAPTAPPELPATDTPPPAPTIADLPLTRAAPAAPAAPVAARPAASTTHQVKLDFGSGKPTSVNVASAADAETLVAALEEVARRTAR